MFACAPALPKACSTLLWLRFHKSYKTKLPTGCRKFAVILVDQGSTNCSLRFHRIYKTKLVCCGYGQT